MSDTISIHADSHELKAEKSGLGLTRPDHASGIVNWLTTVDHKKIGVMYGLAGLLFFVVGGIEVLLLRIQLSAPELTFVSPQTYNQLFTMHGTTMIFLGAMPMIAGFFNFLVPLQIGARDVAFPRLNAFSLWVFMAGAVVLNISWLFQLLQVMGLFNPTGGSDIVPAVGWFGYAPLSTSEYSGIGGDFWVFGLQILGFASIAASLNFIVTILNMRAPGLTMMRMPVFTWMALITSFLVIFAFPALTIALLELMFDRLFGTNFFRVDAGGQPILWQHLFWIFGHPEVYILILPALGIISEILPTFSRKPLFGYPVIVFSGAVIGFLGFAVWSHHMFTTGLGDIATAAFSLLTMAIAVPTGVKIFNWIGTLWGGRIWFSIPMIYAIGFIWMFMMGGFSGIMHAAAPADSQQQDTYFVVAHFHYIIIGGIVMALFGGIYYWLPKITGRMWTGAMGYWAVGLIVVGLNITFFPMHFLGLLGMPRRTHTYLAETGFGSLNLLVTVGAFILAFGILLVLIDTIKTLLKGPKADKDPWDARTLEWTTSSPPKVYNFDATPIVTTRDAYWYHKHGSEKSRMKYVDEGAHGVHMPSQSWFPLMIGIGMMIMGVSLSLHSGGIPLMGYIGIGGISVIALGVFLWLFEGPGGYHVHVEKSDQ